MTNREDQLLASPAKFKIRYFLWTDEGPYRLSDQLHREVLAGCAKLDQFAGTSQKLVELIIPLGQPEESTARGMIYQFNDEGFLDVRSMTKSAGPISQRFLGDDKISDLTPAITTGHFRAVYTWKPSSAVLDRLRSSFDDSPTRPLKIPLLKNVPKA